MPSTMQTLSFLASFSVLAPTLMAAPVPNTKALSIRLSPRDSTAKCTKNVHVKPLLHFTDCTTVFCWPSSPDYNDYFCHKSCQAYETVNHKALPICTAFQSKKSQLHARSNNAIVNVTISAASTETPAPVTALSTVQISLPDPSTTTAIALEISDVTTTQTSTVPTTLTTLSSTTVTDVSSSTTTATDVLLPLVTNVRLETPAPTPVTSLSLLDFDVDNTCAFEDNKCACKSAHAYLQFLKEHHPLDDDAINTQQDNIVDLCIDEVISTSFTTSTTSATFTMTSAVATSTKEINVLTGKDINSSGSLRVPLVLAALVGTLVASGALLV